MRNVGKRVKVKEKVDSTATAFGTIIIVIIIVGDILNKFSRAHVSHVRPFHPLPTRTVDVLL